MRVGQDGEAWVSSQVLGEFASTALRQLMMPPDDVAQELRLLVRRINVLPVRPRVVLRGLDLHARYGVNFWDGLILAAAEAAGCERGLSEDLNAGQFYGGCGWRTRSRDGAAIPVFADAPSPAWRARRRRSVDCGDEVAR